MKVKDLEKAALLSIKVLPRKTQTDDISEEDYELFDTYFNKFDWNSISRNQYLNDRILRIIASKKDRNQLTNICIYQKLTEEYMKEFKDFLQWPNISLHQELSEKFIDEMSDWLFWPTIIKRYKLIKFSDPFKEKYKHHWNN